MLRTTLDRPELTGFYSEHVEVCGNPACRAAWEWFDPADLLDADRPRTSSFKEPCENCAFRPGSVEQRDPDTWRNLMVQLKGNGGDPWALYSAGGGFYCHKGLPLTPKTEHGFAYPMKTVTFEGKAITTTDPRKLRPCRGWLRMAAAAADRLRQGGEEA